MLLSIPEKVYTRMILWRIKKQVDAVLREEQAGFRSGRSCTDQIFTLKRILEQALEHKTPLIINFIDFEKAFDSLNRVSLWKILAVHGFSAKYIRVISNLYEDSECCVKVENDHTQWFKILTGVKQGCVLSPVLFGLAMDWLMRQTIGVATRGLKWTGTQETLEDLDFADDIALLSVSAEDMQLKTDRLYEMGQRIGLKISEKKTQLMALCMTDPAITVGGKAVEKVSRFTYLGSCLTEYNDTEYEMSVRIGKAATCVTRLRNIWNNKTLSVHTKMQIYNSTVVPVLLYGTETWAMTRMQEKKLDGFDSRSLRRIMGIRWQQRVSNVELRRRTKQPPVTSLLRKRRLKWLGHALRMDESRIAQQAMTWTAGGKRKPGRPKTTWPQTINRNLADMQINLDDAKELAQNRAGWRTLVSASCDEWRKKK